MCQEAIRRLCNPSERCHVRKVVRLLARPLSKPDFVFMFATVGYDQRSLLQAMREATGSAPLSGCSAGGTISGDDADESNYSVVVMAISSEELRWTTA